MQKKNDNQERKRERESKRKRGSILPQNELLEVHRSLEELSQDCIRNTTITDI
jgi:hypothetical protein